MTFLVNSIFYKLFKVNLRERENSDNAVTCRPKTNTQANISVL